MRVIYVSNYKRKLFLFLVIVILWIFMFFLSDFFYHNNLVLNVRINNYVGFSYPLSFDVDNIYINETVITESNSNAIETTYSIKRPRAEKFKSYSSLEGKFSFSYPCSFTLSQQDFPGSDVLYHINFNSFQKSSHGFVQVWNLPYTLEEFLEKSKSTSMQTYKYFKTDRISVNGLPGYFWDYSVLVDDGTYFKGSEVFFKKDSFMYRISYFVPEDSWNKSQSRVFWGIVNSFKTY